MKGIRGRKAGQLNKNLTSAYDIGVNFDYIPTAKDLTEAYDIKINGGKNEVIKKQDTRTTLHIASKDAYSKNEQRFAKLNGYNMSLAQLVFYGTTGRLLPSYAFDFKDVDPRNELYNNLEIFKDGETRTCKECNQAVPVYEFRSRKYPLTSKLDSKCNICKLEEEHKRPAATATILEAATGTNTGSDWITDFEEMTPGEQEIVEKHIEDLSEQPSEAGAIESDTIIDVNSTNYFHTEYPPAYSIYYKENIQPRELREWYQNNDASKMQPSVAEIEAISKDRFAGASLKDIAIVLNRPLREIEYLSRFSMKNVVKKLESALKFKV